MVLAKDRAKLLSTNRLYGSLLRFLGLKLTWMELLGEVLVYQLVEVFSGEVGGNILGVSAFQGLQNALFAEFMGAIHAIEYARSVRFRRLVGM